MRAKCEIATWTEDLEEKQFGLQIFWEDHKTLDIKHGSEGWKWDMPYRITKFVYLNKRDPDDKRGLQERDLWRDKRLMILDAGGNTHHIDKMWWHKAPIKL